jgi:glycosyltransferase involved in cell wall biosynthesis
MTVNSNEVLVPIPYFDCLPYVRRAIESILNQNHRDIRVIVMNDGDPNPPWPAIADIRDPRLWRVEFRESEGPYFAVAAALFASRSPFLLVQDADDWSEPDRISKLLRVLAENDVGAAISAERLHYEKSCMFPHESLQPTRLEDFTWSIMHPPTRNMFFTCQHHGLFRTDLLRRLGGYYGGFRVSYDLLMMRVMHLLGELSCTSEPLYNRLRRRGSLTTSPQTRVRGEYRESVEAQLREIYSSIVKVYDKNAPDATKIDALMHQFLPVEQWLRLQSYATAMAGFVEKPSTSVHIIEFE